MPASIDFEQRGVQPPALHPVLVGHHRRAEVHRPRHRRRAAAAPEGAPAAQRREARRPPVLLHHAGLDDVELAGVRASPRAPRCCSTTARRSSARGRVLFDFAEAEGMTHFGTSAKFIDALAKTGLKPQGHAPPGAAARDALHRLAARARGLRLRLREREERRLPVVDLGRHRHRLLLRARQPDRAGVARRDPGQGAGDGGRGVRRRRQTGDGRERRAGLHQAVSRRCRSDSGTTPTAPSTARPTSRNYPNVWRHGDWCEETEHGGLVIYGRSDAVLNPGGVRIGTAEIYRQVEQIDEVMESLVIGQEWEADVRVVLFVKLQGRRPAGRCAGQPHQAAHPREHHAAPRSRQDPAGHRTSRAPRAARSSSSRCAKWCTAAR